jgi:hypothetical protein
MKSLTLDQEVTMHGYTINTGNQKLLELSKAYFASLEIDDMNAALDADRKFGDLAEAVLAEPIQGAGDIIARAIIARHYETDRPGPDGGLTALQNGAGPYHLVDAVLSLAGLPLAVHQQAA